MLYLTIDLYSPIPRTASVAFEVGLNPFIDDRYLELIIYISQSSSVTLIFTRLGRILDWVGRYLTPTFGTFINTINC